MTIKMIESLISEIESKKEDDEYAHSCEDDLWKKVLMAIGDGAENAPELAKAALRTMSIKFQRWCA